MTEPTAPIDAPTSPAEQDHQPRIQIRPRGSYLVSGKVKLVRYIRIMNAQSEAIAWQAGDEIVAAKEPYKLCRCGLSKTKPFCDDAHKTAPESEWNGQLVADRAPRETRQQIFQGTGIILTDDTSLCAGYAFCDPNGGVWQETKQSADPQVRAQLIKQVALCPSGRLQYMLKLDDQAVEIEYAPMIAVIHNGPYWVLGGIPIETPDGFVYAVRNRQLLCRCGHSQNKPFCDGTHWDVHFKAP